ncbi:hypothetical protein AB0I94_37300 [Streptomyces sp. NPDC050147]|uniref:hypothetical protein n=1 Tax=Streptomyces sp. NPDC050147 TaxID=3155513 RepID=UPI00342697B8
MSDKDFDAAAPPDTESAYAESPYTEVARARLAMAYEACELAEIARAAVPIGEHELRADGAADSPGSLLADAAHVLRAAQRFFEAAAVCERLGGASWQVIGQVLGVDASIARARFAAAEACFREELRAAEPAPVTGAPDRAGWWRAYATGNPLEAARDLDDWVLRHEDGGGDLGSTPVSGGLTRSGGPESKAGSAQGSRGRRPGETRSRHSS